MYIDLILYNYLLIIGQVWCSSSNNNNSRRRIRIAASTSISQRASSHFSTSVVSLRSRTAQAYFGDNHFCTGCLLNDFFVLTSAKCVTSRGKVPRRPRELVVVAGSRSRLNRTRQTEKKAISFAAVHPNYIMFNSNDIALLKLTDPINEDYSFTDPAPDVLMPPPYGSKCIVMGWGRQFANGPLASRLSILEVQLLTPGHCRRYIPEMTEEMLCAISRNSTLPVGPCPGDTGGPLFCNDALIGIVSYTMGCSRANFPTVYTSVYYHHLWLEDLLDRGGQQRMKLAIGMLIWSYMMT
ncbi:trypsin-2-like [Drosophila tropicalis]|uniref:trypsin-2-like n=1 Tax=Drosophila tropicalis TaxID=46794 RepID=UPI0035AC186A